MSTQSFPCNQCKRSFKSTKTLDSHQTSFHKLSVEQKLKLNIELACQAVTVVDIQSSTNVEIIQEVKSKLTTFIDTNKEQIIINKSDIKQCMIQINEKRALLKLMNRQVIAAKIYNKTCIELVKTLEKQQITPEQKKQRNIALRLAAKQRKQERIAKKQEEEDFLKDSMNKAQQEREIEVQAQIEQLKLQLANKDALIAAKDKQITELQDKVDIDEQSDNESNNSDNESDSDFEEELNPIIPMIKLSPELIKMAQNAKIHDSDDEDDCKPVVKQPPVVKQTPVVECKTKEIAQPKQAYVRRAKVTNN